MVCVISLNIRGLRNRRKRYTTFKNVKKLKCDIICLQETYIIEGDIDKWQKEWGGPMFYCKGTNHSKGNIILINKDFDVKDLHVCQHSDRILGVEFSHLDEKYVCLCIYAPNEKLAKIDFLKKLKGYVSTVSENVNLMLCGDFNCTIDNIDNIAGEKHSKDEMQAMQNISGNSLIDIWRLFHENEKDYTWRHKSKDIVRRLDYIFGNEKLFQKVLNCEIIDFGNTDHRGVICNYGEEKIDWGKSYWKLNNSYLKDLMYVHGVNNVLDKVIEEFSGKLDDQELWEYCKLKVKDFSTMYGQNKARKKKNNLDETRHKLNVLSTKLANDPCNKTYKEQVTKLQLELGILENVSAEGARIRSKVDWIEKGEKSNRYFLNLEKYRGKQKVMSSLKTSNGSVISDQQGVLDEQMRFYSDLYKRKGNYNRPDLHKFLEGIEIPKLNEEQSKSCDGMVTEHECITALKTMKNDSSPGIDGITSAWYKVFWVKIKQQLINSLNASFSKGRLSCSQRKGVICLLHKGKDLTRDELCNWRPLSLTNVDYKILAKVLAIRLKRVIHLLINEDQAGFMKGRSASDVLRAIDDVIEYTDKNKMPGILLALDYSKAFDKLSKEFMLDAFKIFGFGDNFVKWISVLNTNSMSCINYCGWLSAWFPIERGIRQGCPISPMCFILACELLSCYIRQSADIKGIKLPGIRKREIRILQFADDTTLFLYNEVSLMNILKVIEVFCKLSGLEVNQSKTEAMWIGSSKNNVNNVGNVSWRIGLNASVKILGVKFNNNKSASDIDENWEKRINKCENIIKSWRNRNVDVLGRIILVKALLSSQFIYLMQAFICPEEYLDRLNTLFFKFIWSKGDIWKENDLKLKVYEKVKRKVMFSDIDSGGLNMINIRHMQTAMTIKWVSKLLDKGNGAWRIIPDYYLNTLGKDFSVFKSNTNLCRFKGMNKSFPDFYATLIKMCLDIKNIDYNVCDSQVLWNNDLFTYHDNVIFCKRWIDKGIIYVKDILKDGVLMSFDNLLDIVPRDQISMLEYNVVANAVRKYLPISNDNMCSKIKDVYTMDSKQLRKYLLAKEIQNTEVLGTKKWVREFGEVALDAETWLIAKTCTQESRLIMLHWKILQNIYPTRILLKKMKKVEDDYCKYCGELETIEHFFFHCKIVKSLWNEVHKDMCDKSVINVQECILGRKVVNCRKKSDTHLILVAKLCISKYKYGEYKNLLILYEQEKRLRKL